MSSDVIKDRSEILFLYDVTDANPNGDPNDENKPRMDEETDVNIVTDVRLKRTVRDYLHDFKKKEIFIREIELDDGSIQDAKTRAEDFLSDEIKKEAKKKSFQEQKELLKGKILEDCIDVRMFGATIPLELATSKSAKKETGSITLTGPVQFKIGRSLHPVNLHYIKGTGAFASKTGSTQKTFREEYVLNYSFIAFHGIINENAARHTMMTESDKALLLEGLWMGTANLISRSKFGHMPRFLLAVDYKDKNYFIGDLNKKVSILSDIPVEKIRGIDEFHLNVTDLFNALMKNKSKIGKIRFRMDENLRLSFEGKPVKIQEALKEFAPEEIEL